MKLFTPFVLITIAAVAFGIIAIPSVDTVPPSPPQIAQTTV